MLRSHKFCIQYLIKLQTFCVTQKPQFWSSLSLILNTIKCVKESILTIVFLEHGFETGSVFFMGLYKSVVARWRNVYSYNQIFSLNFEIEIISKQSSQLRICLHLCTIPVQILGFFLYVKLSDVVYFTICKQSQTLANRTFASLDNTLNLFIDTYHSLSFKL